MLKVTSLAGSIHYIESEFLQIIDPALIKANADYFEEQVYKSFPVWLGNDSAVVVKKGGLIKDVNLFKAVMNGHSIELTGNMINENKMKLEAAE